MGFKILAINPGSTSTKIALYDDEQPTLALTLRHSAEEIARFPRIIDQFDWRKEMVLEALAKNNFDVKSLSAVIGRGGLIKPIESGVYEVNAALKNDLVNAQRTCLQSRRPDRRADRPGCRREGLHRRPGRGR